MKCLTPVPNTPVSSSGDTSIGDEDMRKAFDVYATPFVPEALKLINRLPGVEVNTPPARQIAWARHSSIMFESGLQITLAHPPLPIPVGTPYPSVGLLDTASYESHFFLHLNQELESQRKLNAVYSVYNQKITVRPNGEHASANCVLSVPGLKENAPFLEEDDVVELRQLVYDADGKLCSTDKYIAESRPRSDMYPSLRNVPGWTGVIYRARVIAVRRVEEKVTLKVAELAKNYGGGGSWHLPNAAKEIHVNVQFPASTRRHEDMMLALRLVQLALTLGETIQERPREAQLRPVHDPAWLQAMLFPTERYGSLQTRLHRGKFRQQFFDKELNWEQKKAVQAICERNYGSMPYLVSGPPGTGKTKTIIEIALQLLKRAEGGEVQPHILLCAPSENATDTLAIRLRDHFRPGELLRLNRPTRTFAEVPGSILHFCDTREDAFDLPPLHKLLKYKVVVTSCQDAALLVRTRATNVDISRLRKDMGHLLGIGIHEAQKPHWTALLMDEAAQAMEPEALIPLMVVAPPPNVNSPPPVFVLVGDQYQLSPRTSLPFSPLKESLFSRLFNRPVYKNHPLARGNNGEDPPVLKPSMLPIAAPPFTNLFRNYRSHSAILAVPSSLFYYDTLEPEAVGTDRLGSWQEWKGRRWPVLFHHNEANDELEGDGGGWYNMEEIRIAMHYAASLHVSGLVAKKDICIMSPFKAQVMRLRKDLKRQAAGSLHGVNVGPTEAFQGLEYDVVILCTTRARERFLRKDQEVGWGIVGNANAMNVALTRAKYGLIVIGRREILATDPNWTGFLEFCDRNGLVSSSISGGGSEERSPVVTELKAPQQRRENDANGRRQADGPKVKVTRKFTRLEKVLLAQETELERPIGSRALGGVKVEDDEMWANERPGLTEDDDFDDGEDGN